MEKDCKALGDWQVDLMWSASASTEWVCVCVFVWRTRVREKSTLRGEGMDMDDAWHTQAWTHTQDTPPVRFCRQRHQGPAILMQQCKKSSLPSSKYAWIKAWITMASCHLKTGLLLSNKQTYPSPGLIGLIKEVLLPLFPGALKRKGILKC